MAVPDNRIRLSSTRIDFATEVGLSGQQHDDYPLPGGQARYDHMRMFLIGLLAQQSSFSPPSQFREGTPWFDLNTFTLKIHHGDGWITYAEAIGLTEPDDSGQVVTLKSWFDSVQATLASLSPEIVFSGHCTADGIGVINLPQSIQGQLVPESRVIMYINGALIDPRNCALVGSPPTTLRLSNIQLSAGDNFTVAIRRIGATFLTSSVVVP